MFSIPLIFLIYLELNDDDEKIQLQSSNSFVGTQYWCLYSTENIDRLFEAVDTNFD